MAAQELNLRDLLEQDRQLVLEVLELNRKLILEVEATHYWLKHALDNFKLMGGIAVNLSTLMDTLEPFWGDSSSANRQPEGIKLWKTAIGLYRALQPVRGQLTEQISRRRRQRIMGEELVEPEELDPETIKGEMNTFREMLQRLEEHFTSLKERIEKVPPGLAPPESTEPQAGQGAPEPATAQEQPNADLSEAEQAGAPPEG